LPAILELLRENGNPCVRYPALEKEPKKIEFYRILRKFQIVRTPRVVSESALLKKQAPPIFEDGVRVVLQRTLTKALGAPSGGAAFKRRSVEGVADLPIFLAYERIKPFINADLSASLKSPVEYIPQHGGRSAFGIKAELIPQICDVWLKARDASVLT
jgi:hypothetical protein